MYTRNYRIQHSVGHSETPRDEAQAALEIEKGIVAEELSVEKVEKADSSVAEPELFQSVAEMAEEDVRKDENEMPPRKPRAVKHYRVRSATEPKEKGDKPEELVSEMPLVALETNERGQKEQEKAVCTEPAFSHHPGGRQERCTEKKPFGSGQNPFGIKNFSPEDIFLAAILLLLLNEGCEDIMTLILGFLLLS